LAGSLIVYGLWKKVCGREKIRMKKGGEKNKKNKKKA